MSAALLMSGIGMAFGRLRVLEDVSLEVARGERRAVIGPNGAGKTTLFHIMSGLLAPSAGRVALFGADVTRLPMHRRAALGLSRTFQITNLFAALSVEENVMLALQGLRPSKFSLWPALLPQAALRGEALELLRVWRLDARRHALARELSYGEQRTLEILLAVAQRPRLLLLDEPTAGLSPAETQTALGVLRALPADMSIVLIEHDMDVAFQLCERVSVLHSGRVLASGSAEEVRRNAAVRSVYLGGAG